METMENVKEVIMIMLICGIGTFIGSCYVLFLIIKKSTNVIKNIFKFNKRDNNKIRA